MPLIAAGYEAWPLIICGVLFLGQSYPGALVAVAVSKRMTLNAAIGLALAAVIAVEGSVLAQYDRDGRYVPSPMGVPQDPYAAPIPMYPGTPGGAVGTPTLPRAFVPEIPVVPPLQRDIPQAPPLYPRFVPLTLGQCGEPWSRATKVTPTEFRRRCASMLKHQEELKRKQERGSILERRRTLGPFSANSGA